MRRMYAALLACAACAVGEPEIDTPTTPKPPASSLVELDFCNEVPEQPPWEYEEPEHVPAYDFPHCNNHGISTIEQVVAQTGLRRLVLHDDWDGGFAVLAPLGQLESLRAVDTTATDLASLRRFTKLTELSVHRSQPWEVDVTPLADLARLRSLELLLSYQEQIDLTSIGKLSELRLLRVAVALDGKLTHVDALRSLAALRELDVGVLSARQVGGLPALAKLSFELAGPLSFRALAHQTDIEELSVSAERITDFAVVRRFPKLRRMIIDVRRGTLAISQLRDATGLTYLYVPVFAVRYRELAALRAKRPAMIIELGYSPCDIPENETLGPGELMSRAELDRLQRTNGRCR